VRQSNESNAFRLLAQRLVTWSPKGAGAQAGVVLASGAGIALASGYRAVPSLGNDVVTYMPVARKYFDEAYLMGDLPIRDPDGALSAWGWIIRVLTLIFGFDRAFFAVSLVGSALLAYGIYRLVALALGAGHRAGMLAAMAGLTLTLGGFGYTLSIPSHAAFFPTPRFLAIALSVVAISLILERALFRGVVLGLVSTAINTLDGLVPVGLAILAVLIVGDMRPRSETGFSHVAKFFAVAALISIGIGVTLPRLPTASTPVTLLPGSLTIVTSGALIGLAGWAILFLRPRFHSPDLLHYLAAGTSLAIGGIALASRRGSADGGFIETVRAFETILINVRQDASMILLSATTISSALRFCAALFATFALISQVRPRRTPLGVAPESDGQTFNAVLMLALLTVGFVAVGSLLMERTNLPFLVTIWPVRVAWVVVLAFVATLFSSLARARKLDRIGTLPAFALGLLLLQGPVLGRSAWGAGLLAASCLWVALHDSLPVTQFVETTLRPRAIRTLFVIAPIAFFLVSVARIDAPEIRITDSMSRIEQAGGANAEIVQIARVANAATPPGARILVPPDFHWGAFRLLSERGVAFEWKNFSTAESLEWYQQLRWMCDPDYVLTSSERFAIGGSDIVRCHEALSAIDIDRVAERFDADFAVVRREIASGMTLIGLTQSGDYALVRIR
jgi:hypothetical protein